MSITVPSTVTVPAGNTTFTFTAHRASTDDPNHPMPATTTFTASTPDGSAQGGITNNSSDPG
ncbi:hypothetical protein OP10G_1804 [Fimbriimonas ginsengisoli Gsoil 348]|uniref:Uncharacterized protein n=1 Tax=Fimbriimonas ginsengisoli Gsoil 348 TaxID=661478 RepID=A0A068NP77_FIMGI|nr:hypothetical protein OP10G_1804 [Fimbriimonas ginsengisoli Gsoil 348]